MCSNVAHLDNALMLLVYVVHSLVAHEQLTKHAEISVTLSVAILLLGCIMSAFEGKELRRNRPCMS